MGDAVAKALWQIARGAALAALVGAVWSAPAEARKLNRMEQRGKTLLTRFCSECHAVGTTGRSPHPRAPEMRNITKRYDIDDLAAQLREGFSAPHPDMPTFNFSRQDAEAVQAYLHLIQK